MDVSRRDDDSSGAVVREHPRANVLRQPRVVEIALGELLDKIISLHIKPARIAEHVKRANVCQELEIVQEVRARPR
jgi:hypothetical protein